MPHPFPTLRSSSLPSSSLSLLVEPLAAGSDCLFDLSGIVVVELANPSKTLESVDEAELLAGANRAMVGGELVQFGDAEIVEPGIRSEEHKSELQSLMRNTDAVFGLEQK